MKKEFMRYALIEELKSKLGIIVSTAFKKFRQWWEQERKPCVVKGTKESVLNKLRKYSNHPNNIENRKNLAKKVEFEME